MAALWDLPSDGEAVLSHVDVGGAVTLDVGCGSGSLVAQLNQAGAIASGIEVSGSRFEADIDPDAGTGDRPVVAVAQGQALPFAGESHDLVVFMYSLHHVPVDLQAAAITEAVRVLRVGGQLVVAEPLVEGPGEEAFLVAIDETEVRARAQQTLDARPRSLSERLDERYETSFSYENASEVEADVVGIDPDRRAIWDTSGDELVKALFSSGHEHAGRHWWPQPVRLRIFVKEAD